jgi:hypothetical protein
MVLKVCMLLLSDEVLQVKEVFFDPLFVEKSCADFLGEMAHGML